MAQYFRLKQAASTSTRSLTYHDTSSSSAGTENTQDVALDNTALASSSILIFPRAPSERRSSYSSAIESQYQFSGGSSPSLPTDVSIETLSGSGRGGTPTSEQPQARSVFEHWERVALSQANLEAHVRSRGWDKLHLEEASASSDWEMGSGAGVGVGYFVQPQQQGDTSWLHISPSPPSPQRSRTTSILSSPFSRILSLSPEPPFRLPFLSFLQSFISLDESTLHIISRSPDSKVPVLFASSPGPPSEDDGLSEDTELNHGTLKLLLFNPDKPEDIDLLKKGLDPSEIPLEVNPFLVIPSHLSVWKLVKLVLDGGTRVWKEVKIWGIGEPPLIGV
ncbi:hypothetical protein M422DRAFT_24484 [Sphaerobolus stellatus SS14]|nr:hypothetical protein M422DRAFT_24484 [Sphaerobolus stellatus SS14]